MSAHVLTSQEGKRAKGKVPRKGVISEENVAATLSRNLTRVAMNNAN